MAHLQLKDNAKTLCILPYTAPKSHKNVFENRYNAQ